MVIVPLAAYLTMVLALRRRLDGWRLPLVTAAVVWGLTLTVVTETLSRVHALRWPGLLAAWTVALGGAAVLARRGRPVASVEARVELDAVSRALSWITGTLVLTIGLVAVLAPPNTADSLTYHMSRVAHWAQNGSVDPYPTGILRQLYQSPAAEFVILQLQILSGGDRFANLVQWAAMLGSLAAASLVARQLGGGPATQVLAAVVVATIPMGVLQASSTQNDHVTAFWTIAMVALGLASAARLPSARWLVPLVGGALGLAILTKPTAYLFGAPFVALIVVFWARRWGTRRAALAAAAMLLVAAVVNVGQYSRNVAVFGSPFGPRDDSGYEYGAGTLRPAAVASTVVRNAALQLATPSEALNGALERAVRRAHLLFGLDPDDPRVTWRGERFSVPVWTPHEDRAGNPLHFLLMGAAVVAAVGMRSRRRLVAGYAAALVLGWLLFSAALKWQPWHSRLELPIFVLGAPLVALVCGDRAGLRAVVAAVLLAGAIPTAFWNQSRPLVGADSIVRRNRTELYFVSVPGGLASYAEATHAIRELACTHVGLEAGGSSAPEYPIWVLLRSPRGAAVTFEHVGGVTPPAVAGSFVPCAIVAWNNRGEEYGRAGVLYRRVWGSDAMSVYAPPQSLFLSHLQRLARERPGQVRIVTEGDTVRRGQRVSLRVDVGREPHAPLELYAGLLFPDRAHVSLFTAPGVLTPPTDVRGLRMPRPLMLLPAASADAHVVLLDDLVAAETPLGTFRVFAGIAREAASHHDDIFAADVLSIHVAP